jgi:hypothetical protein
LFTAHNIIESHIWGEFPLHRVVLTLHAAQLPALHAVMHAGPLAFQLPFLSHVAGALFRQPSDPGMQDPVHMPCVQR